MRDAKHSWTRIWGNLGNDTIHCKTHYEHECVSTDYIIMIIGLICHLLVNNRGCKMARFATLVTQVIATES